MTAILKAIHDAIVSILEPDPMKDPPLPANLADLQANVDQLKSLNLDFNDWSKFTAWLDAVKQFCAQSPERLETLIVRALQIKVPIVAEVLTLFGVITFVYENDGVARLGLNWDRLLHLVTKPQDLVSPAEWAKKISQGRDVNLLQVLLPTLFMAQRAALHAEYDRAGFAALPSTDPLSARQQEFIALVNSPARLPLKLLLNSGDPDVQLARQNADALADYLQDYLLNAVSNRVEVEGVSGAVRLPDYASISAQLPAPGEVLNKTFNITPDGAWQVTTKASSLPNTLGLEFNRPNWKINYQPAPPPTNGTVFEIALAHAGNGQALNMAGAALELSLDNLLISFGLRMGTSEPAFSLGLRANRLRLKINPKPLADLGLSLGDGLSFETDIALDYVQGQGLRAQGGADGLPVLGLKFARALGQRIGGAGFNVTLETVTAILEGKYDAGAQKLRLRMMLRTSYTAQLGPVNAVIDDLGGWVGYWDGDSVVGLEPPRGIGISIDAGPVKGGGFLKAEPTPTGTRYSGALQLKILMVNVFALGILERTAAGNVSFVTVIGARFPGIQLGFGFMLTGIGGLVGINRTANVQLMGQRMASGASGNVLFCDDPLTKAPSLLGDLAQFFPPQDGTFVIGPTLQINWLYLLKLDLGVLIELPGPQRIAIIGSARAVIGSESLALIYLRMDFMGGIDFAKQFLFFYASLVNSHVLGILRITGGIAFELMYGSPSYILFSVGGFHPRFNPGSMPLPRLDRAGASLNISVVVEIWIRCETYFAFTSNSLQFGAKVEAGLKLGPIKAHGYFQFDALIQFKPFYFDAEIAAGFSVEVFGVSLCSVDLRGSISGPGPIVIRASASVRILFVKVSASVTFRLGESNADDRPVITDLLQRLTPELSKLDNLRMDGSDASVIVKPRAGKQIAGLLITPMGALVWEQKRLPLKVDVERFEGMDLDRRYHVTLDMEAGWQDESDSFGTGMFSRMSGSEALNNTTYQQMPSGVRIVPGALDGKFNPQPYDEKINLVILPHRLRFELVASMMTISPALNVMTGESRQKPPVSGGEAKVSIAPETFQVVAKDGSVTMSDQIPFQAFQVARRTEGAAAMPSSATVVNW